MNILDIIIGIILILFAIAGLRKGLITEVFYLASFVIGIYGAMFFSDAVANWMSGFTNIGKEYLAIIAFIITLILIIIAIRLLGNAISFLFESINLGFIDKIGGVCFGIFKGALFVSIIILIMNVFGVTELIDKNTRNSSFLYSYTERIANVLYKNHDVVKESIEKSLDKAEDIIETSLSK